MKSWKNWGFSFNEINSLTLNELEALDLTNLDKFVKSEKFVETKYFCDGDKVKSKDYIISEKTAHEKVKKEKEKKNKNIDLSKICLKNDTSTNLDNNLFGSYDFGKVYSIDPFIIKELRPIEGTDPDDPPRPDDNDNEFTNNNFTTYKKITITGSYNSSTDKIMVKNTLEWLIIPNTRFVDLISIIADADATVEKDLFSIKDSDGVYRTYQKPNFSGKQVWEMTRYNSIEGYDYNDKIFSYANYDPTMVDHYKQNTMKSLLVYMNLKNDELLGYLTFPNPDYYNNIYCTDPHYSYLGNCNETQNITVTDNYLVTDLTLSIWANYTISNNNINDADFAAAYVHKINGIYHDLSKISFSTSAPYIVFPFFVGNYYDNELSTSITVYR